MQIRKEELTGILAQFNPWWKGEPISGLPDWHRAAFRELFEWTATPPAPRAVLLSGPRQVGKTTLALQTIQKLLDQGVPPSNILYATFDHPIIKLAGIDAVIEAWREREPKRGENYEYLFLDEAQFIREWGTWIKHQVDFVKERRIIFTGSAMPIIAADQESGVGRWHTIRLTTLSFYEYIQLKKTSRLKTIEDLKKHFNIIRSGNNIFHLLKPGAPPPELPPLPELKSLHELFTYPASFFASAAESAQQYFGHFYEYLLHGGFPQTAQMEDITQAQRLLREDIIEKVLKRDMTALFGVRHILELEHVFIYLCMHPGGLLDMQKLSENLSVKKPTALNFISILEKAHLIYRLAPYGYGKEVLRAKYKVYLADPSLAPAVLLTGKSVLENPEKLGTLIETAVFKHLYTHYYQKSIRFTYWQNSKKQEVDLVAELGDSIVPFEIKYRSQHTNKKNLSGLAHFCNEKKIERGYIVTKELSDFGPHPDFKNCNIMRIPAMLLCYWMGLMELDTDKEDIKKWDLTNV